jgi:hypothetical protein
MARKRNQLAGMGWSSALCTTAPVVMRSIAFDRQLLSNPLPAGNMAGSWDVDVNLESETAAAGRFALDGNSATHPEANFRPASSGADTQEPPKLREQTRHCAETIPGSETPAQGQSKQKRAF